MANFFIRRPIVAMVISIIIVIMGLFTLKGLSFEQYPFLAPPTIRVTANYPGASAVAVEQSVATPIEQEVNGVDKMIYMKSSNTSDGRMQLDVNFEVGIDQDTANVLTQNRVNSAQARLPQEVVQQGVTVKKQSPSILMVISVFSPKNSYDANFLINYSSINIRDQILRIQGVAQVDLFGGADYGMRVWLRPDRMANLGITPSDVISAIKDQNIQAPAGRVGMAPSPKDQEFTYTVSAPGRLVTAEEFENIIVRETATGAQIRIKDIGRTDLGSQDYNSFGRLNGQPGGTMAVYLLPGANQLQVAHAIYETMARAKGLFLPDMDYKIVYDTTPAVEASIEGIVHTFIEAVILVTIVVFIFLQNFRATIIPLLTVPVSLIGTFIFFPLLGFSVNTLSMFGLVLAIGIVVDDNADGEDEAEHRQRVHRKAKQRKEDERADERDRHGQKGDDRRAEILQEDENDDRYENYRLDESMNDPLDRRLDGGRRVVNDLVVHVRQEEALRMPHGFVDRFRRLELIGSRKQVNGHRSRRLSVETAEGVIVLRAQLRAADVLDADLRAGRAFTNDDVLEFMGSDEAARSAHGIGELLIFRRRRHADASRRRLEILLLDRRDHIRGREPQVRQPVGSQPDAHAVIRAAQQVDLSYAGNAQNLIAQIDAAVIDQKIGVIAVLRRIDGNQHQNARALLFDQLLQHQSARSDS